MPWVMCAWALATVEISDHEITHVGVPEAAAQAKPKGKAPVSRCVRFSQEKSGDAALALTLKNRCDADLSCSVGWSVRCDADTDGKRKEREVFTLLDDATYTVTASADVCGDDGWAINDVTWACQDLAESSE